jgi:hypothetical protein
MNEQSPKQKVKPLTHSNVISNCEKRQGRSNKTKKGSKSEINEMEQNIGEIITSNHQILTKKVET